MSMPMISAAALHRSEKGTSNMISGLAGTPVFLAVTELVRGILSGAAETETGPDALVVLFSVVEPNMLGFASFEGVGGAGAPVLRLLYTVANDVGLP